MDAVAMDELIHLFGFFASYRKLENVFSRYQNEVKYTFVSLIGACL